MDNNGNGGERPVTCVETPSITCFHLNRYHECKQGARLFCCPHCQTLLAKANSEGKLSASIRCSKCKQLVET